jgi:hypothetical protein
VCISSGSAKANPRPRSEHLVDRLPAIVPKMITPKRNVCAITFRRATAEVASARSEIGDDPNARPDDDREGDPRVRGEPGPPSSQLAGRTGTTRDPCDER